MIQLGTRTVGTQGTNALVPPMQLTIDDCLPLQCGAPDPDNIRLACAEAGYVGARVCTDPVCVPYLARIPGCTSAPLPSMVGTSQASTPPPQPYLTPDMLIAKLPSIVESAPIELPPPPCPNQFAVWVSNNPLLAIGLLVGAFYVVRRAQ